MKTGPTSATGKAIASQNSYKHGVYAQQIKLRADEQPGYDRLRDGLLADLKPHGALQTEIFTRLLRVLWVTRRLDDREDQVFLDTGLPLSAALPKEFENQLRHRRFLAKEERELRAELSRLQTEAAIRDLGDDFSGFDRHSILVSLRPLVELHNLRCATRNDGKPKVVYSRPAPAPAPKRLASDSATPCR